MGRYSTDIVSSHPPISSQEGNPILSGQSWPTSFPKCMVSMDLNGTIVVDKPLMGSQSIELLPGVTDAIRNIRLKGHKLFLLSDQPLISKGIINNQQFEQAFQHLMYLFGQAGIYSIDGMLYNTSDHKQDEYAKPNIGMIRRAEKEILRGDSFKGGIHVGDSIEDLKMANKAGMRPVLIKTGKWKTTLEQLEKYSNNSLKKKVEIYDSLLEFSNTL